MIRFWLFTAMCVLILTGQEAWAQQNEMVSAWGPEDERGAANRITPAKVLAALDGGAR